MICDNCCNDMVFRIPEKYGPVVLLLNIICPGLGTCATANLGDHFVPKALLLGVLQALLVPVLFVGWYWSIVHGIAVNDKAKEHLANQYSDPESPSSTTSGEQED